MIFRVKNFAEFTIRNETITDEKNYTFPCPFSESFSFYSTFCLLRRNK